MAERSDTSWQQGFVLSAPSAVALGLVHADTTDAVVILISHDCDLLEPPATEPYCEVIVGRKIETINGLYTNAKNPRRLHLPFSAGATHIAVELVATDKKSVKKDDFLSHAPLD